MKKKKLHIRTAFRFRKWCRKAYAVFRSIGQYVTIGNLTCDLSEQTLKKQAAFPFFNFADVPEDDSPCGEKDSSPDLPEQKLPLFILPVITNVCPDYSGNSVNYPIRSRETVWHPQFSDFFFIPETQHHDD